MNGFAGSSEPGAPTSAVADLERMVRACRVCRDAPRGPALPHEPRPILRLSGRTRLVVASQAPGIRAHTSGVPFDDASGERLRSWMGIGPEVFYDPDRVGIVPMGFCFPGHDAAKGDLPPRVECRPLWHDGVFAAMPQVELVLAIGLHAIRYHMARLGRPPPARMAEVVRAGAFDHAAGPRLMPLPHPSWRNSAFLNRNPWFAAEVLPVVRNEVARLTA